MGAVTLLALGLAAAAGAMAAGQHPARTRLRRLISHPPPREPARRHPGVLATRPARAAASVLAGTFVASVAGGLAGLLAGPAAGVGAWIGLSRLEPAGVARRRAEVAAAVPLAADLLAAALAAGSPPAKAAASVGAAVGGPLGAVLRSAASAIEVGADPSPAWAPYSGSVSVRSLARALDGAVARGSSPVPGLERVASDARDTARREAESRARALGARAAAPLGLCFLPAFVLVGVIPLVATVGLPLLP